MRFYVFGPRFMGVRPGISLNANDFLKSKGSSALTGSFVYVVRGDHHMAKIGVTTNPAARIAQLRTGSPFDIDYACIGCTSTDGYAIEARAHATLAPFRRTGEWFDVHPEEAAKAVRDAAEDLNTPLLELSQSQAEEAIRIATAPPRRTFLEWYTDALQWVLVMMFKIVVSVVATAILFAAIFLLKTIAEAG